MYDPLEYKCTTAPWVNGITCLGHSECVVACPSPNCRVEGDRQCIVFDGANNHDFSREVFGNFNDYFNSLTSCQWWNDQFKSKPRNASLSDSADIA